MCIAHDDDDGSNRGNNCYYNEGKLRLKKHFLISMDIPSLFYDFKFKKNQHLIKLCYIYTWSHGELTNEEDLKQPIFYKTTLREHVNRWGGWETSRKEKGNIFVGNIFVNTPIPLT